MALVAAGADPASERAEARQGPGDDFTVRAVASRFVREHVAKLRPSTRESYEGIVRRRLVAAWGPRALDSINRRDVARLVDGIADEGHPVMARLTFAVVRVFFGWCVERSLLDANPCDGMKGPPTAKARDRVLTDDEVRLLWRATGRGGRFDVAARLLLLTGCRRDEVGASTWAEIDTAKSVWTLAADRCKNGVAHEVDLAPAVLAELAKLTERQRHELTPEQGTPATDRELSAYRRSVAPYVFRRTALAGWSKAKRDLDARMAKLAADDGRDPPAPWRWHDLRRTAASGMAGLGFGPQVVERVLNHLSGIRGGLVGVYQRHEYRAERRTASLAWAAHVERVVAGRGGAENVVVLRLTEG